MTRLRILSAALIAVLPLAACEPADNEPGPGGVTVGEAKALDEAAEMIEARRPPEGAFPGDTAPGDAKTDTDEVTP